MCSDGATSAAVYVIPRQYRCLTAYVVSWQRCLLIGRKFCSHAVNVDVTVKLVPTSYDTCWMLSFSLGDVNSITVGTIWWRSFGCMLWLQRTCRHHLILTFSWRHHLMSTRTDASLLCDIFWQAIALTHVRTLTHVILAFRSSWQTAFPKCGLPRIYSSHWLRTHYEINAVYQDTTSHSGTVGFLRTWFDGRR